MPGRTGGSSSAAPRPLGAPVPCPSHQGPTRPQRGHCPESGSGSLGLWVLNQLPAMQSEVSRPALPTEQGSPPAKSPPPWGRAQGALTGTHKHRTLPLSRWAPYMQTMLNMQLWGPPWGPSAHPSLGDGPPAVAGLRLLGHGLHFHSLAYHPSPPSMGPISPLPPPRAASGPLLPFQCPLPGAPSSCQVSTPLSGPPLTFDSTRFCVLPEISHRQCSHVTRTCLFSFPRHAESLTLTLTQLNTWRH